MKILHWNAQSLGAHGDQLKKDIYDMKEKPEIICIQETWFGKKSNFRLRGYEVIRKDREIQGESKVSPRGGCITCIKKGIAFQQVETKSQILEVLTIKVFLSETNHITCVNIYNPCKEFTVSTLEEICEELNGPLILCGDFNSYNVMWGSKKNDMNGRHVEEFIDNNNLVCLNDGTGTRLNIKTGKLSCLDLTMMTASMAAGYRWQVLSDNWGSDHFPVVAECGNIKFQNKNACQSKPRWSLQRANWDKFQEECAGKITYPDEEGLTDEIYDTFIAQITEVLNDCVPKTKVVKEGKSPVPWWNEECNRVVREKKKALNALKRSRLPEDFVKYKKKTALARKTIKEAKRNGWREFCEGINTKTPTQQIWNKVKSISNTKSFKSMPCLSKDGQIAISDIDKANMLARSFSKVSSTDNYNEEFQEVKREAENNFVFNDDCNEVPLNDMFTFEELKEAIGKAKCTAPGGDGIGGTIIKKLPWISCQILLSIFNIIWVRAECPSQWKEAILTPIAKPGKDPSNPLSYRPIALTSCFCKIMERMINNRLNWFLEVNNLINNAQSGFRKGRKTTDHLTRLESSVNMGLANKESTVAIFLDLEKAYDMVWRQGVIIKMQTMGIGGRMLRWVDNFLTDRYIQVKVNGVLSGFKYVENGTPQGSVISPTIFNIAVSDLPTVLSKTKISQFADDIAIWKSNRNIPFLVKQVQQDLDAICGWCRKWGFNLSPAKSTGIIFSNKKKVPNFGIKIFGADIGMVKSAKFLGLVFDSKMTWSKHVDYIIDRCKKRINLLRCISGSKWGAHGKSLLNIYKALIRPVLDYGCEAYDSAADSIKNKLDSIQYKALKISTGAISRTSLCTLQIECGEPPLHLRRRFLARIFKAGISNEYHPNSDMTEDCWQKHMFKEKWISKGHVPFAARDVSIPCKRMGFKQSPFPFWYYNNVDVNFTLFPKVCGIEDVQEKRELAIQNIHGKWFSDMHIYTDGSVDKGRNRVGCGIVIPQLKVYKGYRLSDDASIFTAELLAIYLALVWVADVRPMSVCIFSDSMSALQGLAIFNPINKVICDIRCLLVSMQSQGIGVHFDWVPGHCEIAGNESADFVAKQASRKGEIDIDVGLENSEIKGVAKRLLKDEWQKEWNDMTDLNWLKSVQPKVSFYMKSWSDERSQEVVFHRLRLGKGKSLNNYLFQINKHENGKCQRCGVMDTIEHLLFACKDYDNQRD
jgi:ribonuclease HI/exonuclease III